MDLLLELLLDLLLVLLLLLLLCVPYHVHVGGASSLELRNEYIHSTDVQNGSKQTKKILNMLIQ